MLWTVSQAPFVKLQAYKCRMGWSFRWASSLGSDFNFDLHVSYSEEQQHSGNVEYNFRKGGVSSSGNGIEASNATEEGKKIAASTGTDWATYIRETPGMSAFALEDGVVYHTYLAYARGVDGLWSLYQWLDRAPRGRNETGLWIRRRDEHDRESNSKGASKDCYT